jgi:hypothetical protein
MCTRRLGCTGISVSRKALVLPTAVFQQRNPRSWIMIAVFRECDTQQQYVAYK